MHYDFDNLFLLIISLKTIWKKRLIFSILISEIWFFNFEVSLFFPRNTLQTSVDMKWCPCVKELSKESCQLVSILMPRANFVNQKVHFMNN